ncbi:hypothetical protein [Candidatus Poriferisocius sp.]|uniref:hypothetical protein n=1 Tax=Candidatus Poriferisocius sp. TaxID=3101276 RepID=UPI003B02B18C
MALVASVLIWAAPDSQAQNPNIPPVAIATLGAAVPDATAAATADPSDDFVVQNLVGTRSFDPDAASDATANGIAVFQWEVVTDSYKDWLAITGARTGEASFIVPNEASIARYGQTIEFKLTVWDANPRQVATALSDTATVTYNFRDAGSPTADITVTALLPNPTAVEGYDDDGDGLMDEDDEQFTVDAIISRPGEGDNTDYEWHIKEGALLTIDGSGSSDPDTTLTDANFTWRRIYDSSADTGVSDNAADLDASLPGAADAEAAAGVNGKKISSSTDVPTGTREALTARTVVALANTNGTAPNPFYSYYRLTIDDNGDTDGGNMDSTQVLIVIHDQPNDPTAAGNPRDPASRITATAVRTADTSVTTPVVQSSLGANRFLVPPGNTVTITAAPWDADIGIAGGAGVAGDLITTFDGARPTAAGALTATVAIPRTAPQGTEYEVNITVTDRTKRSSTTTVTIVAVRNTQPEAVAPDNIIVGDGANGGDKDSFNLPTGTVALRGIGFDADGNDLTFNWTEKAYPLNTDGELDTTGDSDADGTSSAAIRLPRKAYLSIDNADQESASFSVPEVDDTNLPTVDYSWDHDNDAGTTALTVKAYQIPIEYKVTDSWGHSRTDIVVVTVFDNEVPRTVANPGANQEVAGGSFVRLNGSGSRNSAGTTVGLTYQWTYIGISTDPLTQDRPALSRQEIAGGYVEANKGNASTTADKVGWLPYDGKADVTSEGTAGADTADDDHILTGDQAVGTFHPTAGGALKQADTRFPYFDAPSLHGFSSIKLQFELTVTYTPPGDSAQDPVKSVRPVTITVSDGFYSGGTVTGPDFCTGFSLGGPQTFAFDSDGDGVADICSLKTTRREAVATQNAYNELAALNPDLFKDHLHGKAAVEADATATPPVVAQAAIASQCKAAPKTLGDSDAALNADACGPAGTFTRRVSSPPAPVDPAVADVFFSGIITDANFCTNRSLGGQPLYANDTDGDGVADICSLGYTRREAVARQNALQMAFSGHDQFAAALARACAELGTTDFGDSAASLANDRCSKPRPAKPGTALPKPAAS